VRRVTPLRDGKHRAVRMRGGATAEEMGSVPSVAVPVRRCPVSKNSGYKSPPFRRKREKGGETAVGNSIGKTVQRSAARLRPYRLLALPLTAVARVVPSGSVAEVNRKRNSCMPESQTSDAVAVRSRFPDESYSPNEVVPVQSEFTE